MNMKMLSAVVLLSLPLVGKADPKSGTDARAWVDLQKSGKAASKQTRPVPGEVADKTYERYVKSFDHPIPETYNRESFTSGGDSSGGNSK